MSTEPNGENENKLVNFSNSAIICYSEIQQMISGARDSKSRKFSARKRLTAGLVFLTLLLTILPISSLPFENHSPKGMVFCPLSKKFQPIILPESIKEKKPFDAICASTKTKDFLFQEIFVKTPWRIFTLDAKGFEHLVFEYLAHGKPAFHKLPFAPYFPSGDLVERAFSIVISNNRSEHNFTWKHSALTASFFTPDLKPRPPTTDKNRSFSIDRSYRSALLSRRLSPRAPPLS